MLFRNDKDKNDKDDKKSERTFVMLEGKRWSIPGDHATVEADGSLRLLGRGSQCINTGGEKVYPNEVENVLKTLPVVQDCLVVGRPDEKWGQQVCVILQAREGQNVTLEDLRQREHRGPRRIHSAPQSVPAQPDYGNRTGARADL